SVLHKAFLPAFSDYQIAVESTEKKMVESNCQRGIDYSCSFGAFTDCGELAGFIFCGVRKIDDQLCFYDGATGVIPSFRGQRIAGKLLDAAIEKARSIGAHAFILEVLKNNERAIPVYRSRGFSETRTLICYEKKRREITHTCFKKFDERIPDRQSFIKLSEKLPLAYAPSWQNSTSAVTAIYDRLTVRSYSLNNRDIGYFVLDSRTGSILQVAAEDHSLLSFLFASAAKHTDRSNLRLINIEQDSPLDLFAQRQGWNFLIDQFEMTKQL
ncbi:MAG: GNAT family N-acetyltransferase, partial [Sphaerochaetaceae bacterium]|nr:GNAT family N-acetyltransferase [Sphaerochaetaceae bacterium]